MTNTEQSQITNGWRAMFSLAPVYRFAQAAIGAEACRDWLTREIIAASADDVLLDMGCGTADILDGLADCTYIGFDPSKRYIDDARERFGARGSFFVAGASEAHTAVEPASCSIAIAIGVLHHVSDETARSMFDLAAFALRPGGRLITFDPTLTEDQHPVARALVKRDRGQHVRSPEAVAALVPDAFGSVDVTAHHDRLRPPYSHVLLQAARV